MSKKRIHEYKGDNARVTFEASRCIHAAECVHGLPKVFDPKRRPWIDMSAADSEQILSVVEKCPSGALKYQALDESPGETVADENTIKVVADGTLYAQGNITITTADGERVLEDTRVALCRCGASKNKPFCDGSHKEINFNDTAVVGEKTKQDEAEMDAKLVVKLRSNGPLLLTGRHCLIDGEGSKGAPYSRNALCRCGHSANKPFCDGSHVKIGFEA